MCKGSTEMARGIVGELQKLNLLHHFSINKDTLDLFFKKYIKTHYLVNF